MIRRKVKNPPKPYGLIGKRFGELVVLRPSRSGRIGAWIARCDCGKLALVYDYLLKSGQTTNCGCDLQTPIDDPHPRTAAPQPMMP